MKRVLLSLLLMAFGFSAMAQQSIQLRSSDKAQCVKSDMRSLKASFSFSTIQAEDYQSERGTFSWLSMANTVLGGNAGDPRIPVVNELIAVPFGAQPRIEVTSYSTTDYRLEDFGMKTLVPRQRPVRKNRNPEEMPFVMNESAYQISSLRSTPNVIVSVDGIMRGIQIGKMTIEPVSYDPVNNTLRVFNDIEVTVYFDGANAQATEDILLRTYSPAFDAVYAQLFNNRAITDVYTDHPDMYNTPVRMLVICYSGFQGNAALNNWLQWKLQKGYYVDIYYTNETGTTASAIASFIKTKYNASVSAGNAYTYLIVIGDTEQVPQYMTKTIDTSIGECASDLGYSSVNFSSSTSNYFPDMYYSRISVENTTHLTNYMNKVLTYEKYEFADGGNYLNNVILVGGWDSNWTNRVAKPTINYATNNYFNSSNTTYGGFGNGTINAIISTSSTQGWSGTNHGCYNGLNDGVCFLNYTAHGDKQEWQGPQFTAKQVEGITNTGKYFFGVGNCCLTGNYNLNDANYSSSYAPSSSIGATASFGETMIRVPNAGAIAYVGCSPYSYWYEDFYWAVGAHTYSAGNAPSVSSSAKGVYDVMFQDQYWNSASALMYLGNLAVQQAVTNGNQTSSITDGNCNNSAHYYFQFYHTFGDGSIMPYITKPETNTVTIPEVVTPGTNSITVNALAGSYVAVTDNNSIIYGVAEANASGVATVNFTNAIPNEGTLYVVVTRQQYQPYFGTISVVGGAQYEITATVNPDNAGTVTGTGTYYETVQCTLTATPNHGYAFDNWKLGNTVVSTDPSYTFTVTGEANYTANFHALTLHQITYEPNQTHGDISATPTTAYMGDVITLTATPAEGYCLHAWHVTTGRAEVPVVNNQFEMPDADVTITAEFREGYTVTLASVMNGTIDATPTTALDGTTITLTATPATGYDLDHWDVFKTGDPNTTVTVNNNSFTMPAYNVTVSAVFNKPTSGDVTIGSGTSTSQYIPTYNYYDFSLTQQIYTQAEVGEAGRITHIAFYVSANPNQRTLDIYMSHTSKSSFSSTSDWVAQGTSYRVVQGYQTFGQTGWNVIPLDTPFEYNGTDNLLITVDDNTDSWVSSKMSFYVYSTGANRAHYTYQDDTDFNPASISANSSYNGLLTSNNQIILTKEVPSTEGILSVAPTSLTGFEAVFGNVASTPHSVSVIGSNLQANLVVSAPNGYEVCATQNGTYNGTLTLTPTSGSLRANFFVRLKSDVNPGTYSGDLTLTSGTTTATVGLSGEVIAGTGEQYTITVNASPAVGGTVTGGGTYYENTHHDLTATPNTHYVFEGWQLNGSIVSTANPYNITVTGDATYTAVFTEAPQYSVILNQVEGGTISANPMTAYPGDVVTLNVNTENGYFLTEWNVTGANGQSVVVTGNQFTMPECNVTVTATFSQGFNVTLEQTANGTISADQTEQLQPGDIVTLTATPDANCVLLAWYVYKTGDPRAVIAVVNDSYFIMPASDVTVMAVFVTQEEHAAQLGSGTSTNNYIPTYVRANYSLTQQIYLASELNNQKGSITKIAYYGYSNSGQTQAATRNLTIYISHTDKDSFSTTTDWETMGSTAKVFEGSVTFSRNSWATITLNTPFDYDGESNINICVVDNTGSTSGSNTRYIQFYRYSASDRALYANGSSSYANTVGYSNQLSNTTGTRISYVNRINITMLVPGSAESLTVSPGEINDFSYVEGQGPSANFKLGLVGVDLSNDITVNAPSNFEISLTEDGSYSNSLTILRQTGSKGDRNVTTWDFEGTLDGWTALDADNDGYGWVLGSACGGVYLEEGESLTEGHSGSDLVVSGSYTNVTPTALDPDNWLISPQVTLGGSFSMWAKGHQPAYPAEHFGIYVSTTGTNPSDFTLLNEYTATATWKNYSVDLSTYAGISGYIAVRHFGMAGNDQFILDVDDFVLDTDASITIEMPVTITPATIYVRMAEGLEEGTYSGTITASAGTGDNLNGTVSLSGEVTNANYWTPVQVGPNTMTMIAEVQINGVPVTECENYELGAFCGAECRGDVIGPDDEPVFFLTIYGNENDENTFSLYDITLGEEVQGVCSYTVTYHDNDVIGTYAQPVVLNFVTTLVFTKDIIGYSANAKDRYYLIASPIGTVSPTNVTNMLANNYDLYYFDQSGTDEVNGETVLKEWRNYEVNNFSLTPGKGYLYANSQNVTLIFSGTPYNGNGEVTLSKTANVRFSGWNLVGNPFAETAYITKPFYTMNGTGTEIIAGDGNSVDAMEGIFVIANNDGETMTFSTNTPTKGEGQIVLNVNQGDATLDRAIVRVGEGDVLPKFMLNQNNTKVYITQEGHDYSVVRIANAGVIPVSFKAARNGEYSICVNVDDTEVNYLHLIDNMTGADVDVLQTPTYSFDATKDDYTSRFKLVFATGDAEEDNFAFFTNDNWIISNDGEAVLQVIDINGRVLSSEEIHGSQSKHINAAPGIYLLRLINGDNVKVQKIVIR